MLGELSNIVEDLAYRLQTAIDARYDFVMTADKDDMPRGEYLRRLNEMDEKISELRSELLSAQREYDEVLRRGY